MEMLQWTNMIIGILFFVLYTYQFVYIPVPWLCREKPHHTPKANHYAVLICARNEQQVIGDLIASLRAQTYNAAPVQIFVLADNCTDNTAIVARCAGATVYERFNTEKVGKGYALQTLLHYLERDYPDGFDGYFVFDADNILEPDYIERMNETFSDGHEIVTGYRNSKNYGDNWISAGYALWFLRESRYLNHARFLLGTSCAISGTGFLFSRKVLEEMGPWPFHLLTEDIEFSVYQITRGKKVAFCPDAILYDEQPTSFRQSCRQRQRWAKGYLQVFRYYGGDLLRGMGRGNFSCFDMSMSIMPAFLLTTLSFLTNTAMAIVGILNGVGILPALLSLGQMFLGMYATFFFIGTVATISEWSNIHTSAAKKIAYLFTFPLFMFTYLPISLSVLFQKVEWKPIEHHVSASSMQQEREQSLLHF